VRQAAKAFAFPSLASLAFASWDFRLELLQHLANSAYKLALIVDGIAELPAVA